MDAGITLGSIWSDEDMVELSIEVSDGKSTFSNKVAFAHNYSAILIQEAVGQFISLKVKYDN